MVVVATRIPDPLNQDQLTSVPPPEPDIVLQPKIPPDQIRALEELLQVVRPAPDKLPTVAAAAERLVEDAVVAKKVVEVALVVVELPLITKFALMVDEALAIKPLNSPMVVVVDTPQLWTVNGKAPPPPLF